MSQKNLDLFVSYAEALAEYEKILTSSNKRYNLVISVASQKLQEYIHDLLKPLRGGLSFTSLTEWLDSNSSQPTLLVTTNPSILEIHLVDHPNATGILLNRSADVCMNTLLASLISTRRIMLIRRPLKHRQLIQTVQMLTTSINPQNLLEPTQKPDQLGTMHPLRILVVDDNSFNQMVQHLSH